MESILKFTVTLNSATATWLNSGVNNMRLFPAIIFAILMALLPFSVLADELLMGEVISVDRDKSEVVLHVKEKPDSRIKEESDAHVKIKIEDGKIPGGVRQGRTVKIWAKPSGAVRKTFSADHITPGGWCDMTGVRGRLRKVGGRGLHGRGGPGRGYGGRGRH